MHLDWGNLDSSLSIQVFANPLDAQKQKDSVSTWQCIEPHHCCKISGFHYNSCNKVERATGPGRCLNNKNEDSLIHIRSKVCFCEREREEGDESLRLFDVSIHKWQQLQDNGGAF